MERWSALSGPGLGLLTSCSSGASCGQLRATSCCLGGLALGPDVDGGGVGSGVGFGATIAWTEVDGSAMGDAFTPDRGQGDEQPLSNKKAASGNKRMA